MIAQAGQKVFINKHRDFIRKALLIRKVEERLLGLFSQGKINGTVHTCVGQEFSGVCVTSCLQEGDCIVSNHRGHGHFIAWTGDVKGLIAEVMGRIDGVCGGYGGSQHLLHKGFYSSGIQGGMTPSAAGIALAYKLNEQKNICVVFIGDGTLGEGVLYEVLNICATWELPVLFILENNKYAQSTSMDQVFKGDIEQRVRGFGLEYRKSNTGDIDHLLNVVDKAVQYTRNSVKPCFMEIETYRLNAHSKGDDNRDPGEIEKARQDDVLANVLKSNDPEVAAIVDEVNKIIENAVEFALASPPLLNIGLERSTINKTVKFEKSLLKEGRVNESIYEILKHEFSQRENLFMIGEDIEHRNEWAPGSYGGAFKVTKDLSDLFPGRVRNTPISEAAIIGIGVGLSLVGFQPIVEIMFGDFMTLSFDQLFQHACKIPFMYGKNVDVPLIIRTPMGGKRGYGPTHSQSIEKFFLGFPGLSMIALNHRVSPQQLYANILAHHRRPTLVIENKILYTRQLDNRPIVGFEIEVSDENFPCVRIRPVDVEPAVTIFCYGGVLEDVEAAIQMAYDEYEIPCEVICPSMIFPINIGPLLSSLRVTKRLLTVEEGPSFAALGSELVTSVVENGIALTRVARIGNDTVIPSSYQAELNLLPSAKSILNKISEMTYD